MKQRNLVQKHSHKINKPRRFVDRKKESKNDPEVLCYQCVNAFGKCKDCGDLTNWQYYEVK